MNKEYVDVERFYECLNMLIQIVKEKQGDKSKISFRTGFLDAEEGYKKTYARMIREELRQLKQGELSGRFVESMKDTNLLGWRDREYVAEVFKKFPIESEKLLCEIYLGSTKNDEALFDEAIKLFGERYPIISYMFFLKDEKEEYIPVRPRIFSERFKFLGIDASCLKRCTWKNYQTFCDIIRTVQELLKASEPFKDSDPVELIDAHSFVWMMWLLEEPDKKREMVHDPDDRKSIVCNSEGKLIKYYGTRYERNRRNREIAIAEHGCKCMVCGLNFKEVYGELGEGFIEVHHIKPLYLYDGKETKVNPKTDLVCLCSNCHSMIHRGKGEPMSVEELKELYEKRAEERDMT